MHWYFWEVGWECNGTSESLGENVMALLEMFDEIDMALSDRLGENKMSLLKGWVRIQWHFWEVGWEWFGTSERFGENDMALLRGCLINRRHFWEVAWIKGSVQGDKSKFFCGKSLNTKKVFLFYYIQSGHGTNDYIVSKSVSKSYTAMFRDRWSVSIYCTVYIYIYIL